MQLVKRFLPLQPYLPCGITGQMIGFNSTLNEFEIRESLCKAFRLIYSRVIFNERCFSSCELRFSRFWHSAHPFHHAPSIFNVELSVWRHDYSFNPPLMPMKGVEIMSVSFDGGVDFWLDAMRTPSPMGKLMNFYFQNPNCQLASLKP